MSKIYEALENAGRSRSPAEGRTVSMPVTTALPKMLEDKLLSLSRRIESLIESDRGRIVEFVAVEGGEDSSLLAFEFAKLAALRQGTRVLLLASGPHPYVRKLFASANLQTWEDLAAGDMALDDVIHAIEDTSMAVSQISRSDMSLGRVITAPKLPGILDELRDRFDLIILDAPALSETSSAALLSPSTDGVVIVIHSGRVRWQVVKHNLDLLGTHGARVLGVLLNRRRYYIPSFIYRRLL